MDVTGESTEFLRLPSYKDVEFTLKASLVSSPGDNYNNNA